MSTPGRISGKAPPSARGSACVKYQCAGDVPQALLFPEHGIEVEHLELRVAEREETSRRGCPVDCVRQNAQDGAGTRGQQRYQGGGQKARPLLRGVEDYRPEEQDAQLGTEDCDRDGKEGVREVYVAAGAANAQGEREVSEHERERVRQRAPGVEELVELRRSEEREEGADQSGVVGA